MLRIATCNICNKEFPTNRSHTKTCGSTCRNSQWRLSKTKLTLVKLMFTFTHHQLIQKASATAGVTVAQYLHNHITHTMGHSQ
jgi:hypothetical protein